MNRNRLTAALLRRGIVGPRQATGKVAVAVEWENLVNAAATGTLLYKNAGGTAYNGGANISQALTGDGHIEVTRSGAGECGLGFDAATGHVSYTTMDYGIRIYETGIAYFYENNVYKADLGNNGAGAVFRLTRSGTLITVHVNGALKYASLTPSAGTIYGVAALNYASATPTLAGGFKDGLVLAC